MKHSLNEDEQLIIDLLLERLRFEYIPVRLTSTMLGKSIIDARGPLRHYFGRSGIADFSSIPQGAGGKIQASLPLVLPDHVESRTFSFYRPEAKQGDPRIWIEKLGANAAAGDLLVFVFAGENIGAMLVKGDVEALAAALSTFVPSRFDERAHIEGIVQHLGQQIRNLQSTWVPTMRPGPTGVGYTLETLLGLAANTSRVADFEGVELKAYRRGATKGPGKLVTLFSQVPSNWLFGMTASGLLDKYGYENAHGRRQLYCTITRSANTLGFALQLAPDDSRALVAQSSDPLMSYSFRKLESRLLEKHPSTLFVRVRCRGKGNAEEFCYEELTYCREPSFANFLDLVQENLVGVDLTLSRRTSGATRDHGYLWRIRESAIPSLYAYRRTLIEVPSSTS